MYVYTDIKMEGERAYDILWRQRAGRVNNTHKFTHTHTHTHMYI